jgi:1,4-dihydroxy-2-naphthoyl-CoA hydrolase
MAVALAASNVTLVDIDLDELREAGERGLPGLIGIEFLHFERGLMRSELELREEHLAPNGFLHAGTVTTLADSTCGYGCILSLPEGATGFTTIELKVNFLRTAREGMLACEARLVHEGRTTQVWDATVTDPRGRTLALFRCTELILRE